MSEPRLDAWEQAPPESRVIAILGDSVGEPGVGSTAPSYPDLLRARMAEAWGTTGLGLHGCWRREWSFTTGADAWQASRRAVPGVSDGDSWAVGPLNGLFGPAVYLGSGVNEVATWTKPTSTTVTAFRIWLVDGPTTTGDFSYRIDGGAWTDSSNGGWVQTNDIVVLDVALPVAATIEVRGANAAGTPRSVYLVGIEALSGGTGITFHDFSAAAEFSLSAVRPGPADWATWIDLVQPQLVIFCYTNDIDADPLIAQFPANLQAVVDRVAPYGTVVPMVFWGQDRVNQAHAYALQGACREIAAAAGAPCVDLLDRYGDFATVNALGYMADGLHPSDRGAEEMARVLWSLLARSPASAAGVRA